AAQESLQSTSMSTVLPDVRTITADLMQVHHRESPALGRYVQVNAPVMGGSRWQGSTGRSSGSRLLGYVMICVVEDKVLAQFSRVITVVAIIGVLVMIFSLPLVYVLVHRIFQPIRQLVSA